MSETTSPTESSQTTTQTMSGQPMTFSHFSSFIPDSTSSFDSHLLNSEQRRVATSWLSSASGQSPLPGQPFLLNPFFQASDMTQNRGMGYYSPIDYRTLHNGLNGLHGLTLMPPTIQWPPPMEFHNVTESDMRERGKAAAAAGKSLESPFVINQGLPPEYRQFLPQIQPQSDPSSSPTTPSPFVVANLSQHPLFQQLSSPLQPTNPYPTPITPSPPSAPVTNGHPPNAELDQIRACLPAARKSGEHSVGHMRVSGDQSNVNLPVSSDPAGPTPVGIGESSNRGKRLKMFQETSEESFEESLMNGGYGMYRTSEQVPSRDPLPAANTAQAHAPSSSVHPLSLKDARKRKRLSAFLKQPLSASKEDELKKDSEDRLKIVVIEGMGRVLSPVSPTSLHKLPVPQAPSPTQPDEALPKKRGGYRKRRPKDASTLEKPDWPDNNFFWRSRTDEREKERRFELDEKMKMIHGYLDTSDDEDKENDNGDANRPIWRFVSLPKGEQSLPPVPIDPGDARAVLMSKKTPRVVTHRHKRKRVNDSDDDTDDGTEDNQVACLGEDCRRPRSSRGEVQCDHCYKWFHLACIGVRSAKELGPEEQNWYCDRCDDDLSETPKGLEHLYHPQPSSPPPEVPFDVNGSLTPSNAFSSSPLYPTTPLSAQHGADQPLIETPSKHSSVGVTWSKSQDRTTEAA